MSLRYGFYLMSVEGWISDNIPIMKEDGNVENFNLNQEINEFDIEIIKNLTNQEKLACSVFKRKNRYPLFKKKISVLPDRILKEICKIEVDSVLPMSLKNYHLLTFFKKDCKIEYKKFSLEVISRGLMFNRGYISGETEKIMEIFSNVTPHVDWTYQNFREPISIIGIDCAHREDIYGPFCIKTHREGDGRTFKTSEWVLQQLKNYVDQVF